MHVRHRSAGLVLSSLLVGVACSDDNSGAAATPSPEHHHHRSSGAAGGGDHRVIGRHGAEIEGEGRDSGLILKGP